SFVFEPASLLVGKFESGTVVDGRQSAGQLALAAALQLLRRFITRIEPARSFQLLGNRVIAGHARRLALLAVPDQAQPLEILADSLSKLLGRALDVGVVEAENEGAAMPARKEPVQHGGTHVADMKAASRAWGKTDGYSHSDFGLATRATGTLHRTSPQANAAESRVAHVRNRSYRPRSTSTRIRMMMYHSSLWLVRVESRSAMVSAVSRITSSFWPMARARTARS